MSRTNTSDWDCTIARAASLIGDLWTLLVLRKACRGTRRFGVLQQNLDVSRNILANRLNMLVDEGLLTRVPYQERPLRHEYRLTDKGRDAYPVLAHWPPTPSGGSSDPKDHRSGSTTPPATTAYPPSSSAATTASA